MLTLKPNAIHQADIAGVYTLPILLKCAHE